MQIDRDSKRLKRELIQAGFGKNAVDAAWPSWWTNEAADSASSRAELRFALARRLGLSPKSLLGERVEFVWDDSALFKHLSASSIEQQKILSAFGASLGRTLLKGTNEVQGISGLSALSLRESILAMGSFVDLQRLLSVCWAVGIPVISLRIFPLESKSMHAMVVDLNGRQAILLGRGANYPAPIAFTLAHEIGHIACGHTQNVRALVDMEDPAQVQDRDEQEIEADQYALSLLTGYPDPSIEASTDRFNGPTLASAVIKAASVYRVEPGTLALCLAYRKGGWPIAMSALKSIYDKPHPVWQVINGIAAKMLNWEEIGEDECEYLHRVLELKNV